MIVKKHKNKNQYVVSDGLYVRDFTLRDTVGIDLNKLSDRPAQDQFMLNEITNNSQKYPFIDGESFTHPTVVIVSNGLEFEEKHLWLAHLPKHVCIIGVNGALKNWKMVGEQAAVKKSMNYYVANNPYQECCSFLPERHSYYPRCVASVRTNPTFLERYNGLKYLYSPVDNDTYSGLSFKRQYEIDDYRNPICAALSLAYRFKANKICLLCCDDSFEKERPGTEQVDGVWRYPQQVITHNLVEANAFWLKNAKIRLADCSRNGKYDNITYINSKDGFLEFFN